ncbi:hypothetical protein AM501_21640 [Aneurinibacillus migulanus]|uniref:Uncharacterized protein n=1 Tax=Aneurinibacillus migulanus TaxID=47500 RepID=A0A0D1VEX7_ANEMI|nr:hypothetical protein [Aneurinibacillus migulanus]KIV54873.1 hypothetical protein TS65_18710 [Aneurinibacillus migulanus]KIV58004.1 hypothetical protein TS64_05450 [Aneurinibacillus migulanus]KON95491.1 hypothetical protein AF333_08340 [Aneurinibacillus migulanus]KPD06223.1 hypothetical protein AM501_21640 [Aneurinibacillus migulanus]MCP1355931.1 hypothetical protein [Aneurinibacillus migulanus]
MSFANWDEIIETCVSYSTNLHAFTPLSPTEKRQLAQAIETTVDTEEFKRLDGPDLQDSWTNKPYDDMPVRKYMYNSSRA